MGADRTSRTSARTYMVGCSSRLNNTRTLPRFGASHPSTRQRPSMFELTVRVRLVDTDRVLIVRSVPSYISTCRVGNRFSCNWWRSRRCVLCTGLATSRAPCGRYRTVQRLRDFKSAYHTAQRAIYLTHAQVSHGGIRLSPNVVKILYKWGFKDALRAISTESRSFEWDKCVFSFGVATLVFYQGLRRRNRRNAGDARLGGRYLNRDWWSVPVMSCEFLTHPRLPHNVPSDANMP